MLYESNAKYKERVRERHHYTLVLLYRLLWNERPGWQCKDVAGLKGKSKKRDNSIHLSPSAATAIQLNAKTLQ